MGGLELKDSGFSLIEVLVAMSILTVGILAVVSMQTTALKTQSRSKLSYQIQLTGQQIVERINANSVDDASILTYNNLKTTQSAPQDEPAKSDYNYFKSLISKFRDASVEISVTNTRPYPVRVRIYWKDGLYTHHLDFDTYILPR